MATNFTYVGPLPVVYTDNVKITTTASILLVSTLIIAANPDRIGWALWNNSANSLYVTYGLTSVGTTPTFILPTFATLSSGTLGTPVWQGPLAGIRNAGSGTVTLYEFLN